MSIRNPRYLDKNGKEIEWPKLHYVDETFFSVEYDPLTNKPIHPEDKWRLKFNQSLIYYIPLSFLLLIMLTMIAAIIAKIFIH